MLGTNDYPHVYLIPFRVAGTTSWLKPISVFMAFPQLESWGYHELQLSSWGSINNEFGFSHDSGKHVDNPSWYLWMDKVDSRARFV